MREDIRKALDKEYKTQAGKIGSIAIFIFNRPDIAANEIIRLDDENTKLIAALREAHKVLGEAEESYHGLLADFKAVQTELYKLRGGK